MEYVFHVERRTTDGQIGYIKVCAIADTARHALCAAKLIGHDHSAKGFEVGKLWVNVECNGSHLALVFDPNAVVGHTKAEADQAVETMRAILSNALDRAHDMAVFWTED